MQALYIQHLMAVGINPSNARALVASFTNDDRNLLKLGKPQEVLRYLKDSVDIYQKLSQKDFPYKSHFILAGIVQI